MISDHYENDAYLDRAGTLIRRLCDRTAWSGKYAQLREELIKELEGKKYIWFEASPQIYGLYRIGDSVICNVPNTQRGHTKELRGKRIRLVCTNTAGGSYRREYMAGEIPPAIPKPVFGPYAYPDSARPARAYAGLLDRRS